jgi:hypothetical protein
VLLPSGPFTLPSARRGAAFVVAVGAAGLLAGCTQTSQGAQTKTLTGDAGAAQAVVSDLSKRASDDDAAGICANDLSETARQAFSQGGRDCAKGVQEAIDSADYTSLDVASVKVVSQGEAQIATAAVKTVEKAGNRTVILGRANKTAKWQVVSFSPADPTVKATTPTTPATTPKATTPAS